MDYTTFVEYVLPGLGAAAVAIGGFLWWGIQKLAARGKVAYHWFQGELEMIQHDRALLRKIGQEFKTNGGRTIKDALVTIETQVMKTIKALDFVLDSESEVYFETDAHGDWTKVNPQYEDIAGTSEHDLKGNGWLTTVADYDLNRVYSAWQAAIAQGRNFDCEFDIQHRTRRDFTRVRCTAELVKLTDGKVVGYIGKTRRITLHGMRNEEAVRPANINRELRPDTAEQRTVGVGPSIDGNIDISLSVTNQHSGTAGTGPG